MMLVTSRLIRALSIGLFALLTTCPDGLARFDILGVSYIEALSLEGISE